MLLTFRQIVEKVARRLFYRVRTMEPTIQGEFGSNKPTSAVAIQKRNSRRVKRRPYRQRINKKGITNAGKVAHIGRDGVGEIKLTNRKWGHIRDAFLIRTAAYNVQVSRYQISPPSLPSPPSLRRCLPEILVALVRRLRQSPPVARIWIHARSSPGEYGRVVEFGAQEY